jgi:heme A synthase
LGGVALLQMLLGIITLVSVTPLPLALAHQFGAAVLWLTTVLALRAAYSGTSIPPLK